VDAPCSNTGVMRRRIDVRWRLRPGDLTRMPDEQFAITRSAISLLKPGGVLVYSTCSLETEENEQLGCALVRPVSRDATYESGVLPAVSRPFRRRFCRASRQSGLAGSATKEAQLHLAWPMES